MAYEHFNIKPDIVCVGKALSGGIMPVSGIFADDYLMSLIKAGEHGSTYGGNPLGMACSKRATELLFEEGMIDNAKRMGEILDD